MKPSFQLGFTYRAKYIERVNENYLILSFAGSLVRVKCRDLGAKEKPGDYLELQVIAVSPLEFRLLNRAGTGLKKSDGILI